MRAEYGGHVEGKTDLHACSCLGRANIRPGRFSKAAVPVAPLMTVLLLL